MLFSNLWMFFMMSFFIVNIGLFFSNQELKVESIHCIVERK